MSDEICTRDNTKAGDIVRCFFCHKPVKVEHISTYGGSNTDIHGNALSDTLIVYNDGRRSHASTLRLFKVWGEGKEQVTSLGMGAGRAWPENTPPSSGWPQGISIHYPEDSDIVCELKEIKRRLKDIEGSLRGKE